MLFIRRLIYGLTKNYILLLFMVLLASCKTTKIIEVPMESIKNQYIELIKYDSIYFKDSIYVMLKKDTIYQNRILYIYKYRYLRDTINITDTIPKVITVSNTKYINLLNSWLKGLISIGIISIIYLVVKICR